MRLTPVGYEVGLIDKDRYDRFCEKRRQIEEETARVREVHIGAGKHVQEGSC